MPQIASTPTDSRRLRQQMHRRVSSAGFITKVMKRRPDDAGVDVGAGSAVGDVDNSGRDTPKKTRFIKPVLDNLVRQ